MNDDLAVELITSTSAFTRFLRRSAGGHETSATWRALALLDAHGPLRVTAFAELDALTQPSATSLIRRLVDEGLARREPDPADRRAVLVGLTDTGRRTLAEYRTAASITLSPVLADLDDDDRADLRRALGVLDRIASTTIRPHSERTP